MPRSQDDDRPELSEGRLAPPARDAAAEAPQERQIAELSRSGLSNPEIATRLFISPRTVEYHLSKVFAKLGIRTRGELHAVLGAGPGRAPGTP